VYLSLGKAAHQLGVTPATVRRWTDSGFLACRRTAGGHRRIDKRDVDELAQAIGDRGHLEAQRQRERELETLAAASLDVISRLDQGELLVEIARHATRLCRCHTCEILEYDRAAESVRVLAEYDARGRLRPTAGVFWLRDLPATRRVLEQQETLVVNADERDADAAEVALMRRYGEKSILMLPLVFRGEAIGMLEVCDHERSRRYSAQELRLCRALAGHAAVALHNARLYSAAQATDAALDRLRLRLAALAGELSTLAIAELGAGAASGVSAAAGSLDRMAAALTTAFEARSCLIADGETVLGAAAAKPETPTAMGADARAAHLLSARVPRAGGWLEISLTLPRPPLAGEDDLLMLAAVGAGWAAGVGAESPG
jgi:excisionase family DNA binding protein